MGEGVSDVDLAKLLSCGMRLHHQEKSPSRLRTSIRKDLHSLSMAKVEIDPRRTSLPAATGTARISSINSCRSAEDAIRKLNPYRLGNRRRAI